MKPETKTLTTQAPGRVCLFGDHQDYLELPIIACAINRYITISGTPNGSDVFMISLPDLDREEHINIAQSISAPQKGNHLQAVLKVVHGYGCIPDQGYDLVIRGDVPINAGLSSSSAVVVAFVRFVLKAFGCGREITDNFIAQCAYEAEVIEQDSPGGKMDQYTIALGGTIFLETKENGAIKRLSNHIGGLVIGESGIPKDTTGLLGHCRSKTQEAVSYVKQQLPDFALALAQAHELPELLSYIPTELHPYFEAAVKNHEITQKALALLEQENLDVSAIGILMNAHHSLLKEQLKITVPCIDAMIDAALEAGAHGAKIVGSGGGGSIVALAPKGREAIIAQCIQEAGGITAYPVKVTQNM